MNFGNVLKRFEMQTGINFMNYDHKLYCLFTFQNVFKEIAQFSFEYWSDHKLQLITLLILLNHYLKH